MARSRKPASVAADAPGGDGEIRVRMTGTFDYEVSPAARRVLPVGWSGAVPAAVADAIEAEGKGARQGETAEQGPVATSEEDQTTVSDQHSDQTPLAAAEPAGGSVPAAQPALSDPTAPGGS